MTPDDLANKEQIGVYTSGSTVIFESQDEYANYVAVLGKLALIWGAVGFGVGWLIWQK